MTIEQKKPEAVIVGMSQEGEKLCAASGRISTQPGDALEILKKSEDSAKNSSLIQKVTKSGHNSTVEHAFFNLAFHNVSIMTEQFLIEYRLASFTVKSRRYVDFRNMGFVTPAFAGPEAAAYYKRHVETLLAAYRNLCDAGIPKEDARFVLPYCVFSNFYCSMNARELLHVLRGMLWGRGSRFEELRILGQQILSQAKELAPGIFGNFEDSRTNKEDELKLPQFAGGTAAKRKRPPVELLNAPANAEQLLARTALIAATQLDSPEIDHILSEKSNVEGIIRAVLASSRPRPLEALNYTFRLNRVSLAEVTHIARHRMQNVCFAPLPSVDRESYIMPPSIQADGRCFKLYKEAFRRNKEAYSHLKSMGVPEEQLVYLVLSGNTMDVVTTINARELLLFFKLRTCRRAQWEIQNHAGEMLRLLRKASPMVFHHFGPSCYVEGTCPEGRLTCGHFAEVHKEFQPKA